MLSKKISQKQIYAYNDEGSTSNGFKWILTFQIYTGLAHSKHFMSSNLDRCSKAYFLSVSTITILEASQIQ